MDRLTRYRVTTDYKGEYAESEEGVDNADICNRLAELEDKLENGQAFELPCAIHDTLYTHKKVFGKWQIEELECWGFHCDGRKILFIDCQNAKTASSNSLRSFRLEDFGKSVFTEKDQAEARLKELKGNKE